jgi:hypothetical protein
MHVSRSLAVLLLLSCTAAVQAQEPQSRAELLRAQREEKQRQLTPYKPNALERGLQFVEERALLIPSREGLYPKLGSITTGSGFAYGLGYRDSRPFKRHGTLDVWAGASLKKYWAMEASATFPELANGRLYIEARARRAEYPEEDYFGLGPDSLRSDQSDYSLLGNLFGVRAGVRPVRALLVGGRADYIELRVGDGQDDSLPSIGEIFDDTTAPGLSQQPDFVRTGAFVEVDYRQPKNARQGGWYRVEFGHFDDRDFDAYTFNRFDVDLRQFVGFFAGRRVLAGRVWVSTSDIESGQQMPFYLMPYLGGNDTLRGFRDYRFRGPHALLLQAEYRWEIWSGLDGALFFDAGKVVLDRSDLDFDDLETDYGFGFRFNTNNGIILRIDTAFGSRDGTHFWIVFGGVF